MHSQAKRFCTSEFHHVANTTFDLLPIEITTQVLSYCWNKPEDRYFPRQVCRMWNKLLPRTNCPIPLIFKYYAVKGDKKAMNWFKTNVNSAIQSFGADEAAFQGHLEWLKFFRENGSCFDITIGYSALDGGHIEIVKYLLTETDCSITPKQVSVEAVFHEWIDLLEWLQSSNLLDLTVFKEKIANQKYKALEWATKRGLIN